MIERTTSEAGGENADHATLTRLANSCDRAAARHRAQ